jgi:hypothetical protein
MKKSHKHRSILVPSDRPRPAIANATDTIATAIASGIPVKENKNHNKIIKKNQIIKKQNHENPLKKVIFF